MQYLQEVWSDIRACKNDPSLIRKYRGKSGIALHEISRLLMCLADDETCSNQEEIRKSVSTLLEMAYEEDNMYAVRMISKHLEINIDDRLRERISEGILNSNGEPDYDLARVTMELGTDEQISEVLRIYDYRYPPDSNTREQEHIIGRGKPGFLLESIYNNVRKSIVGCRLPARRLWSRFLNVNAAAEIEKRDYDLAVGLLNGGLHLALMTEIAGVRTRLISVHRDSKCEPYWKNIRKGDSKVKKAKNILICEDDAVTGGTLRRIIPLIEKLEPENVDVCFSGIYSDRSIDAASTIPVYNNAFHTVSFGFDRLYENIKEMELASRQFVRNSDEK